jgi:hypothetical protein
MPDRPARPRPPAGLEGAGRALWRRLVGVYEFAPGEQTVLEAACRQADDVARLEAVVAEHGPMTEGSRGQLRLSGAVTEIRQGRLALGRLLGQLALPDEDGRPATASSTRARKAARSRWDRRDRLAEQREERRGQIA